MTVRASGISLQIRWDRRKGPAGPESADFDLGVGQEAIFGNREIERRRAAQMPQDEMLAQADMLCLSGGVPTNLPIVAEALRRGIELSNDTQVFMQAVPCQTVGITGSAGKTTTTALMGNMARLAAEESGQRAYVGGNIGDPMISYVDEMRPEDLAVLEISSFQLEQMTISPNVAAILNITPNHLDRHGTMAAYADAKANIVRFQTARYDKNPLIVQGPGAGPAVTAAGVFADLLRVCAYLGAKL